MNVNSIYKFKLSKTSNVSEDMFQCDLTHAPTRRSIPIPPGTKNVNIPFLSYSIANATPTAPTICKKDLIISAKRTINLIVIDFSKLSKMFFHDNDCMRYFYSTKHLPGLFW